MVGFNHCSVISDQFNSVQFEKKFTERVETCFGNWEFSREQI
jgi:hypothetical protein